ncbi:uncharacterized protein LOC113761807 isoform X1 [Coffea eugenioides]|uniref:Uncharacterized protein isoform X1 n=1 Tax=Coffea arabica TaxID=13443 RepID=A0A6P6WIJ1_COFAR|nr:uncharacterized protein LOC113732133 isoform X1 [Coffea arabica]XP_027160747.1 uncharacterized protein LOC113761807 isoform X1 [Coffea eugenioides]
MSLALPWLQMPPPSLTLQTRPTKLDTKSRHSFSCFCSAAVSEAGSQPSSAIQFSSNSSTYRPAVILPGLGNNTNDYEKLALILNGYGVPTVVVKVSRIDWLRNAAGLLDPNYWRGTLRPRPVLDCFRSRYFKKLDEAVSEANELAQGGALSFIGHSAGGWLARVYMQEIGFSNISLLLTLGTPHLPPPKGVPGVIDQTRGLLYYVEKNCPKAVYTPELKYVCIAGRYIEGARFFGSNDDSSGMAVSIDHTNSEIAVVNTSKPPAATWRARFVGQGYKQVCGQADTWGDGVVPELSAHLEGALNISLEGVYHSPVGSDDESRPWYGSPGVVKRWIHYLLH